MKYTVLWTDTAQQDLAAVWLRSKDRKGITSAVAAIDKLLGREPQLQGKVRFDTVRTISIPPLGIDFEIIDDDRLVYVLTAWDVEN